jgi:hypothetical protein
MKYTRLFVIINKNEPINSEVIICALDFRDRIDDKC